MTSLVGASHVYLRSISQDQRTSLSVIASYIHAGTSVLDLGTGSGALGSYLNGQLQCDVDGVTYNEKEASLARPYYRRVDVADLDSDQWVDAFRAHSYDFIVCADVIEHLKQPETVLHRCRNLLKPDGKLLISVPNAAYCGLIAELMEGDFSYRDEGLLDRTHLRFFTRKSLCDFLEQSGWHCMQVDTIDLPPVDSEFKTPLDRLPPAVHRYLLSLPDAAVYQLLVVAQLSAGALAPAPQTRLPDMARALFSAQLYVGDETGFQEDQKVVATGEIGALHQTLRFTLPASSGFTKLRLDPADRPGFLHLHKIQLLAKNQVVWSWAMGTDGLATLFDAPQHEMSLRTPWATSSAIALLYGDDPWIELPIPAETVRACMESGDGVLEVEVGWPMSADYLTLAQSLSPLNEEVSRLRQAAQLANARWVDAQLEASLSIQSLQRDLAETNQALTQLRSKHETERVTALNELMQVKREAEHALAEAEAARSDAQRNHAEKMQAFAELHESQIATANARNDLLQATRVSGERLTVQQASYSALANDNRILISEKKGLVLEKNLLARQVLLLRTQESQVKVRMDALINHLQWIEKSTVFRATRPLVHAKMFLSDLFGRRPVQRESEVASPELSLDQARTETVDIIVPVYKGLEDTKLCIESVLRSQCTTPWRLLVVNDCSPDPELTQWLREFCPNDERMVLLENPVNLGFVGTVNRGMAVSDGNDVLLLNSDTEVANDWLDRLRLAAYSDKRVASVTPFSNNATICSYPKFCQPNELPFGWDTASLDRLCAQVNPGQVVDVPTGVGFCMYIRRDCLDEVGLFDVEQFGKGYGEENDFCCRASGLGWRNLHALDTFVLHTGGVSFGDSKSTREREAVEKLRRLHPGYEPEVHRFVASDPAAKARLSLDVARIRASGKPCVLAVLHDRAGGTLRHVNELATHLSKEVQFLTLTPIPGSSILLNTTSMDGGTLNLSFRLPQEWPVFLQALQALGVVHIHYHHLLGHHGEVFGLGDEMGVSWDITAHDYFSICPQISLTDHTDRYCGEEGESQCVKCLQATPAPGNLDIVSWRRVHGHLLTRARYVLTPSRDTGKHLLRVLPLTNLQHAPHTDIPDLSVLRTPTVVPLKPGAKLRVAVLGGMSRIKGADLLEDVAVLAAKRGTPVEFHLLGHAYRSLNTQPKAALTVHGAYEEADLPQLLEWLKPDLIWFPAVWPETYSYTLSACLVAGLPVLAPNLGAFPERLSGRSWSWLVNWDLPSAQMLEFIENLRSAHFVNGIAPRLTWAMQPMANEHTQDNWSYKNHYLAGLATTPNLAPVDISFLDAHRIGVGLVESASRGLKGKALSALVHVRAMPVMRSVARKIPLRWQTRVKSWLRA